MQTASDRAFFANILPDTDVAVTPLPDGAELSVLVRSPDAPEHFALDVKLPGGARLRHAVAKDPIPGDPPRSLEIVRGDRTLGYIHPPVAIDADGQQVPATMGLDGQDIVLDVPHRGRGINYPVNVDPEMRLYSDYYADWLRWAWTQNRGGGGSFGATKNNCAYYCGLYQSVPTNTTLTNGSYAQWYYRAPANTYLYRTTFGGIAHNPLIAYGQNHTRSYMGLLNGAGSAWESNVNYVNQAGVSGPNPYGPNSGAYYGLQHDFCFNPRCDPTTPTATEQNSAVFGFQAQNAFGGTSISSGPYKGTNTMAWANVYLGDRRPPSLTTATPASRDWTDEPAGTPHTITPGAHDDGLGIYGIGLNGDYATGGGFIRQGCEGHIDRSPCPANWSQSFTYTLNEGVNNLNIAAQDFVDNRNPGGSWTEKIDRSAPTLSAPSGSLWDARNRPDDHRAEGVYASTATLKATATDAGAGVAEIEVYLDGASQRSRGGYDADGTLDWNWNLGTNGVADGTYTVTIVARDRILGQPGAPASRHETTSAPFTITIDRSGDVYAGRFVSGDPAISGEVHVREWARAASSTARREIPGHSISTRAPAPCADGSTDRACESVRIRTRLGIAASNDTDDFTSLRGDADDPDLQNVSQLLAPAREQRVPVETGDLVSIARPWQILPPAHGGQFQRFDFTEQRDESEPVEPDGGQSGSTRTVTQRLYVDAATKMPVRQIELDADGQVSDETFWTYDLDRKETASYPAEFFAVAEPATPNERTEVQQQRTRPMSSAQDRETNSSFSPAFFGSSMALLGVGTFCLARNDINIVVPNPADNDEVPVGEEDPGIPEAVAYAKDTFVTAAYHLSADTGSCRAGLRPSDVTFTVTTYARSSANAGSWRAVFEQDGSALPLAPQSPWILQEGLLPVTINLQPTLAYLVPGVANNTSALMDVGDATIIVTGPFDSTTLASVANQLRSQ